MKGTTILLIVTLTAVAVMFQSEAVSMPRTLRQHLKVKSEPDGDQDVYPYPGLNPHLENPFEYDDEFSGSPLMKRNANGYGYAFGNSMNRLNRRKRYADLLERQVVAQHRQQPRPGCCQCGDHICCDTMCHGK